MDIIIQSERLRSPPGERACRRGVSRGSGRLRSHQTCPGGRGNPGWTAPIFGEVNNLGARTPTATADAGCVCRLEWPSNYWWWCCFWCCRSADGASEAVAAALAAAAAAAAAPTAAAAAAAATAAAAAAVAAADTAMTATSSTRYETKFVELRAIYRSRGALLTITHSNDSTIDHVIIHSHVVSLVLLPSQTESSNYTSDDKNSSTSIAKQSRSRSREKWKRKRQIMAALNDWWLFGCYLFTRDLFLRIIIIVNIFRLCLACEAVRLLSYTNWHIRDIALHYITLHCIASLP